MRILPLYPLKFAPIYKEKIWGGRNLERLFGRVLPGGSQEAVASSREPGSRIPDTGYRIPATVGESWDLADLTEGVSVLSNGPEAGATLTELTRAMGPRLLGSARPLDFLEGPRLTAGPIPAPPRGSAGPARNNGRFPLLLKWLDANDILSLQVHPDAAAVKQILEEAHPTAGPNQVGPRGSAGPAKKIPGAALKTECWYVIESRNGFIYKGLKEGVSPEQFRRAISRGISEFGIRNSDTASPCAAASQSQGSSSSNPQSEIFLAKNPNSEIIPVEQLVRRYDVSAGDFHYLPAGTVHALGSGVVVAEIQTPSDTTYRVTDWGRGREIHVERSMQCIHFFEPTSDRPPGASGDTLLVTEFFTVARRRITRGAAADLPSGRCAALMIVQADGPVEISHRGPVEAVVACQAGDTVLLPAALESPRIRSAGDATWLEITLPENP